MGTASRKRGAALAVVAGAVGSAVGGMAAVRSEHPVSSLLARWQGGRFLEVGDGIRQLRGNDCGPAALAHCLRRLGTPVPYPDPDTTIHLGERGCGFDQLIREARRLGWTAERRRFETRRLEGVLPPAILYVRHRHFVVYEGADDRGRIVLHDPALGRVVFSPGALRRHWTGDALLFRSGSAPPGAREGSAPAEEAPSPG